MILLAITVPDTVRADPLKLCYEDVPQHPWTSPNGEGLNFNLLHRVEKMLHEKFIFLTLPWTRCQVEARSGDIDGFFGAGESPERRRNYVFPMLPDGTIDTGTALYEDRFNVFLRKGGRASWDGKTLISPHQAVVVQRGYVVASMLKERGIELDDSVKSAEDGLRHLTEGGADAAVLQGREAENLALLDRRFVGKVELVQPPYVVLPLYLAINRNTYAANPARIEAIWSAIKTIRATPEYRKEVEILGGK